MDGILIDSKSIFKHVTRIRIPQNLPETPRTTIMQTALTSRTRSVMKNSFPDSFRYIQLCSEPV